MMMTMSDTVRCANECIKLAENIADKTFELKSEIGSLSGMFLARSSQSLHSIILLAPMGLIGDAMSVARTIVEMDIDYAYITTSPNPLLKMFMEYDDVNNFRLAKAVSDLHGGKINTSTMEVLKQRHDDAKDNNPTSILNWAGKSLKERANLADSHPGREWLVDGQVIRLRKRNYELLYADMCAASHSGYSTLKYSLVPSDDSTTVHFGPMIPDSKPLALALGVFLLMCETVTKECQILGFEQRIASIWEEIAKSRATDLNNNGGQ